MGPQAWSSGAGLYLARDEANKQVFLTVRQTQDTKGGTPIYDLNATVGLVNDNGLKRVTSHISQREQEIRISAAHEPNAVLLDPDHDFLREIPVLHWTTAELPSILKYATNAVDRAEAIRALKLLNKDAKEIQTLRGLINAQTPYSVVRAAVSTLGTWDAPANRDVFLKAKTRAGLDDTIRLVALDGLAKADAAEGKMSDSAPQTTQMMMRFLTARANGIKDATVMNRGVLDATDPSGNPMIAGWLKNLQTFVLLVCDDVESRKIEMSGVRIHQICFYKMVTGQQVNCLQFFLSADEKVAGWRVLAEVL